MGIFRKECGFCKKKISKGSEVFRDVKDPLFIGTREKGFCSERHADTYEEESANAKKCGGSCCG